MYAVVSLFFPLALNIFANLIEEPFLIEYDDYEQ